MSDCSTLHNSQTSFVLIGLDDRKDQALCKDALEQIHQGRVFSGGIRHHELIAHLLPEDSLWIDIIVPLDAVFNTYKNHEKVVVFASGDPLFFGFANTIKRRLPGAKLQIFPFFNSLQVLTHRLQIGYDDMRVVSLTGRPWQEFDRALIEQTPKIGLLTDRQKTPQVIAQRMIEYGYTEYTMIIGEHLGNPEQECIRSLHLNEVASLTFSHPNNILLIKEKVECRAKAFFGIPDDQFELLNGRSKMITKAPIRLITLSALGLHQRQSFWDIGYCTGSISIEAKLQFPHLSVTSFEIRPEGKTLMETNSRRFGTPGIETVIGDFLDADLSPYPTPDAVFIGGHGGALKAIIERVSQNLRPGGIIVFNAVSDDSKNLFLEAVEQAHLQLGESLQIRVNDFNPIEILQATLNTPSSSL